MNHFVEPSARGARRARARLALLAAAFALLPALPAAAARVLAVRVGEHPEFTRVVFELDERAGYKVERRSGSNGTELLVTLDASAATRKLTRRGSDVPLVEVKAGEHAVVLIRLRKGDLALKEMILSKPYRVVLDVLREPKPAATAARPAKAAKPVAKAEAKPAAKTESKPVAKVEPKPEQKPAPKVEPPPPPPKPVAKVEPKVEPPKPVAKVEPKVEPPKPVAKVEPKVEPPKPVAKVEPKVEPPKPVAKVEPKVEPPKPVAKVEPKVEPPKPVAKVEPKVEPPKPVAKVEPKVEPKPPAPKAEVPAPPAPPETAKPAPPLAIPPVAKPPAEKPAEKPLMTAEDLAKLVAADGVPGAKGTPESATAPKPTEPDTTAQPPSPPPAVAEIEKPPDDRPAEPKSAKDSAPTLRKEQKGIASWLSNPTLLAAGGGALVCVLAVVFLLRRRRALPNDLDVTAIAEEHGEPDGSGDENASVASDDESSFAGLFDDDETSTPARTSAGGFAAPAKPAEQVPKGTPLDSLFDDDEPHGPPVREGAAKMSHPTDLPMDRTGAGGSRPAPAARPAAAAPAAGGDVMRLVQELERRLGQLETKLDQANEAREKLERQVAAQSEELRVQRAAIARTQRALRTMTRGDEEKATEPALREDTATKVRPGGL